MLHGYQGREEPPGEGVPGLTGTILRNHRLNTTQTEMREKFRLLLLK